ncbi:MAG: hypothetical protein PVG83_11055 [Acidimicrobiia bacterium]|jgi:hypothetical protein
MDRFLLVALCAAVGLTSACSIGKTEATGTVVGDGWWYVSRTQDPPFFRASLGHVVLSFHEDSHCVLGLDRLVVWPAGTEVDPENRVVRFPNGVIAEDGDLLAGGGGEAPAPPALDRCAVGGLDGRDMAFWIDSPDVEVNPSLSP